MKRWIPFIILGLLSACASTYDRSKQVKTLSSGLSKSAALQLVRTYAEGAPGLCQASGGGGHVSPWSPAKLRGFEGDILHYGVVLRIQGASGWMDFEMNLTQLAAVRVMRQVGEARMGCEGAGPDAYIVLVYVKENQTMINNVQSITIALESNRLEDADKLIAALTALSPDVKLIEGAGFF